jgi:hypothetical protein
MRTHQENPTMFHWRAAAAALSAASALLLAPAAWAQNAIQSITSSQQAGTEVVRIELSEPLAVRPRRALPLTCRGWAANLSAMLSRSIKAMCVR